MTASYLHWDLLLGDQIFNQPNCNIYDNDVVDECVEPAFEGYQFCQAELDLQSWSLS